MVTADDKCKAVVEGLKEKDVVQFRVRAANKAGFGEASEPTDNHVVKHRHCNESWHSLVIIRLIYFSFPILLVKPRIDRSNLKQVTIKAGRTHKWSVDVTGEPAPTLTWCWRDNVPLSNTARITIDNVDYHTDFTMTEVTRKDGGKYTLRAENPSGKDEETVELIVLGNLSSFHSLPLNLPMKFSIAGKPSSPKGPLEVSDVHKEGCKITWQKPEDDGGMPIKEYELEKMDTSTGKWVRIGRVNAERSPQSFNVTGLEPGKSYQFRVTASNAEGDSEHLETSTATLANNLFGKMPFTETSTLGFFL